MDIKQIMAKEMEMVTLELDMNTSEMTDVQKFIQLEFLMEAIFLVEKYISEKHEIDFDIDYITETREKMLNRIDELFKGV